MHTMSFEYIEGVMVVIHTATNPSDAEWERYVLEMERATLEGVMTALVVFTPGAGPNAKQRNLVASMWQRVGQNPPTVIITPSSLVRAVITALNYFLPNRIEAFRPSKVPQALASLNLPPEVARRIQDKLQQVTALDMAS